MNSDTQLPTPQVMLSIALALLVLSLPPVGAASDAAAPNPRLPAEWRYLPELGESTIFEVVNGQVGNGPVRQMRAHTQNNVGILQTGVDIELTETSTLQWYWMIQQLPSQLPEDVALNHDYFSIAIQFDNGQDLTYMWSASLPFETGFRCPLRNWKHRETHVVVESGTQHLNEWRFEERSIQADYLKYVGGTLPKRITQVWLIANSSIRHGTGTASFGDISIGDWDPKIGRERVF